MTATATPTIVNRLQKKLETLQQLQKDVNYPKHTLIDIRYKLCNAGLKKHAESLDKIIARLEDWQNRE